jgi:acyl carrier protein
METAHDKLKSAFTMALPLPPDQVCEEIAYGRTAGWDSVAHMTLIAQIEGEFDVMLGTEDVIGMSSFLKAKEILAKHGVSF